MNYRHAFHAGNHGDVLKHVCLLALLDALMRKATPMFVLDTHAGAGTYDLGSDEASSTRESRSGVARLLASGAARSRGSAVPASITGTGLDASTDGRQARQAPALARYAGAIAAHRLHAGAASYPGSPALIAACLRADDRLACCELAPVAAAALKRAFARDARVAVHQRDGYSAIKALVPPVEKRGLVLIDPPYEAQLQEFDAVLEALSVGLARWPQGVFAIWYPIKVARGVQPFLRKLAAQPSRGVLDARVLLRPATSPLALNGSGVVIVNPPYGIESALQPAVELLARTLGDPGVGSSAVAWLRTPA